MVIDTSALVALLLAEPETVDFVSLISGAATRLTSASSYLETAIVIATRSGPRARGKVEQLVEALAIEIVPFTREQAEAAIAAYRRFGRGTGHPAKLNFGDCFSYALAKLRREPLLFKGDDFSHTDIEIAADSNRRVPT
jgi:ribonuclease VapC